MTRVVLRVYQNPAEAEIFINIKRKVEGFNKQTAKVDTGAAVTLLPIQLMSEVEYHLIHEQPIRIHQAGIAQQDFQAYEAKVTLFLEDTFGGETSPYEVTVWFASSREILLGVEGMLDRAILHLDMPNLTGYIDIADS